MLLGQDFTLESRNNIHQHSEMRHRIGKGRNITRVFAAAAACMQRVVGMLELGRADALAIKDANSSAVRALYAKVV